MNKGDVVAALAKSEGMTTAAADRAVNALFGPNGIIVQGLKTGEKKVVITGFGTFEMRHRKAHSGVNLQGNKIKVAAIDIPGFRAGATFKDAVPGKPKTAKKPASKPKGKGKKPASKPKGKGKK